MSIQVGDEVRDFDGDVCTVLAVAGDEAAILHRDKGICPRYLKELTPHTPPAPEPPLTGEQMAYVLETLQKLAEESWRSAMCSDSNSFTMASLSDRLAAAAKEFRK